MALKSQQSAAGDDAANVPNAPEKTPFDGEGGARNAPGASPGAALSIDPAYRDEVRAVRRAGGRWRAISRWFGLIIFLLGVGLLIYVFSQALQGFQQFSNVNRLNAQFGSRAGTGTDWVSSLQSIAAVLGKEVLRVLYLFILGYIASAIAARGIAFFAASEAVIDEAVLPGD